MQKEINMAVASWMTCEIGLIWHHTKTPIGLWCNSMHKYSCAWHYSPACILHDSLLIAYSQLICFTTTFFTNPLLTPCERTLWIVQLLWSSNDVQFSTSMQVHLSVHRFSRPIIVHHIIAAGLHIHINTHSYLAFCTSQESVKLNSINNWLLKSYNYFFWHQTWWRTMFPSTVPS